ncbi:ATP-dependent DNA helicase [Frankliniella fusca]|uniref:ATP-dependent DNA helicase n=1 Tax=Frankliniella fusca TaxID=407009 RepID=A0AAE1LT17_9NEOP|nr:ATP-dependent DNA helicase [Frankliniella fusca]
MNPEMGLPPAAVHPCRKKFSQIEDPVRDLGKLLNREEPITRLFENERGLWELVTARNDSLLKKFIIWVITLWRANMDATPILSLGFILSYISKYTAKGENRSVPCAELIRTVLAETGAEDTARSVIQKLLIKTVSERDYSAQEVCHILSGQPLHVVSSRKFIALNLNKNAWVPLRRGGGGGGENVEEDVDDPEAAAAADGAAEVGDEGAAQPGGDVGREDEEDDGAVATFSAFILRYQQRTPAEMNNMSLFQVAKTSLGRRGAWTRNVREAVVRVFPRLKLTGNDERDENYYRIQVLLHTAWRTEEEAKGAGTWKEAFQAAGLVPDQPIDEDLAGAAAEIAAEEALFEQPDHVEQEVEGVEEWMAVARMGPNGQAEEVELGLREMDLSYDWHASTDAYGDHAVLRDFVSRHRATTNVEPEQEVVVDDVVYTAEQQKLIDLVQTQLDSVAAEYFPDSRQPYKPSEGESLRKFQDEMEDVRFIFIHEFSMIGCRLLGFLEKRLREAKPRCDEPFGGLFVYLIGDVRQLPSVGDPALYSTSVSDSADVHRGRLMNRTFEKSIILSVSQRQADATFRDALDRLSVVTSNEEDFNRFAARFKMNVPAPEREQFTDATHLFTTRQEVSDHNNKKLVGLDVPVARLPARHNNAKAKAGSADVAQGLESVVYLAKGARVMLRSNLWLAAGLVNGATGTVWRTLSMPTTSPHRTTSRLR